MSMSEELGGTEFEVIERKVTQPIEIETEKKEIPFKEEPEMEEEKPPKEVSPEILAANKWIIATCVKTIGNTAYKFTGVEEAKFTDDETESLSNAWAPFLPKLPPITQAIIVTLVICLPKAGIVYSEIRRKRAALPETA